MNEKSNQQSSQVVKETSHKKKPVIIALTVLSIVAILGITSYAVYAYQQNIINNLNKKINTLNQQVKDTISKGGQTTNTTNLNVSYMVIKEWGVKAPQLPTGNILSYQINGDIADVVSSEQKAIGGRCGQFNFSRYSITRRNSSYQPQPGTPEGNKDLISYKVTIGNYTYYIGENLSGGACDENQANLQGLTQAEQTANQNVLISLLGLVAN